MSWKLHSSNLTWKVSYPIKNCPAVFARCGLLHKLLNKFSCPGLGGPMEFVPRNSSSWSFSRPDSFLLPWFPSVPVSFLTIKLPEDSTNSVLASFRSDRSKTHKLKKHGSQTLENDSTFASNEIPKIETNNKPATSFDIQNTNMIKSKSGIPKVIQNFQWNEQLLYA